MSENYDIEYGIKYRVIKLANDKFILFPISLVEGISIGFAFQSSSEIISCVCNKQDLKNKYVIDSIFSIDELKTIYDFDDVEDLENNNKEFLSEYFYNDFKDKMFYIEIFKNTDYIERYEIDLSFLKETKESVTYLYNKDVPSIVLNQDTLDEILKSMNLKEIKVKLEKYKQLVSDFNISYKEKGVTKIKVVNGQVEEIETLKKIKDNYSGDIKKDSNLNDSIFPIYSDSQVSYHGLRKYIKERVFGHDEAIDIFSQKLYMNYTALDNESVDSILLVGPTGTRSSTCSTTWRSSPPSPPSC